MEKVAIIGMGISGMAVASAYDKEVNLNKVEIDCYDSPESFGRGFPFRKDSDEILINLKKHMISYDYENIKDFDNWLEEKGYSFGEYVPRHIFGQYTQDRLEDTMDRLNSNKLMTTIKRLDWLEKKRKWKLETDLGDIKYYDRIHLCCGELPQADPFNLDSNDKYIDSIYPSYVKLKDITKEDTVSIIGTSLSAVDIGRYLLKEKNINKLYMFSRGNIIPTLRLEQVDLELDTITYNRCSDIIESGNGFISFKKFEELMYDELESHGLDFDKLMDKYTPGIKAIKISMEEQEDLAKIQTILSKLTLTLNKIWLGFTHSDRQKFTRKYDDFIQAFGNPLPLPTGKILLEAADSKRLFILDDINNIVYNNDDESFHLLSESENSTSLVAKSDFVCNSTGLDTSLKTLSRSDTLIGSMIDKGYLQVDNRGGITVVSNNTRVLSPRLGEVNTLHAHGVLISGVQLRNNSTSVIQRTAHELIKELY